MVHFSRSLKPLGMTGFRLRDFWGLLVSVRDGTGSRYPHGAYLIAKTADKLATYKNAFANFRMPELALAAA